MHTSNHRVQIPQYLTRTRRQYGTNIHTVGRLNPLLTNTLNSSVNGNHTRLVPTTGIRLHKRININRPHSARPLNMRLQLRAYRHRPLTIHNQMRIMRQHPKIRRVRPSLIAPRPLNTRTIRRQRRRNDPVSRHNVGGLPTPKVPYLPRNDGSTSRRRRHPATVINRRIRQQYQKLTTTTRVHRRPHGHRMHRIVTNNSDPQALLPPPNRTSMSRPDITLRTLVQPRARTLRRPQSGALSRRIHINSRIRSRHTTIIQSRIRHSPQPTPANRIAHKITRRRTQSKKFSASSNNPRIHRSRNHGENQPSTNRLSRTRANRQANRRQTLHIVNLYQIVNPNQIVNLYHINSNNLDISSRPHRRLVQVSILARSPPHIRLTRRKLLHTNRLLNSSTLLNPHRFTLSRPLLSSHTRLVIRIRPRRNVSSIQRVHPMIIPTATRLAKSSLRNVSRISTHRSRHHNQAPSNQTQRTQKSNIKITRPLKLLSSRQKTRLQSQVIIINRRRVAQSVQRHRMIHVIISLDSLTAKISTLKIRIPQTNR